MGGLNGVIGKLAEVLSQLQRLLRRLRLDVGHPNVCDDAQFLLFGLCFCLFELLVKDVPIEAQLSAQEDLLLNAKPLFTPVKRSASDLFALVADGWVRVGSRLPLPAFCRSDVGGRLRERRVVL